MIVDTTVQEKAIAHPADSRLLEIARHKVVSAAKRCGIALKQTFAKEGKELRRKAGGYAHAKQFSRLRKTVKRQRTILGIVMREVHSASWNQCRRALQGMSPRHWLSRDLMNVAGVAPSAFAPSSATARTSSTRCTHPRSNASARARRASPTSSA